MREVVVSLVVEIPWLFFVSLQTDLSLKVERRVPFDCRLSELCCLCRNKLDYTVDSRLLDILVLGSTYKKEFLKPLKCANISWSSSEEKLGGRLEMVNFLNI